MNGTRPHPPISPRTFFWVSTPAPHLSVKVWSRSQKGVRLQQGDSWGKMPSPGAGNPKTRVKLWIGMSHTRHIHVAPLTFIDQATAACRTFPPSHYHYDSQSWAMVETLPRLRQAAARSDFVSSWRSVAMPTLLNWDVVR